MKRSDRLSRRRGSPASWLLLLCLSIPPASAASAAPWVPVGPGAFGSDAPFRSLMVAPGAPGKVWLGMPHGALYRSSNRGASWSWVGRPFGAGRYDEAGIAAIDADRTVSGRLFAATTAGIFRTDDGGDHWTQVSVPGYSALLADQEPASLSVVAGGLYLAAGQRLLVSGDGGRSFEVRFDTGEEHGDLHFAADPSRAGLVYVHYSAGGVSHLEKSTDAGRSWSEVGALPGQGSIQVLAAAGGAVYAAWQDEPALWRSRDGAATWQRRLDGSFGTLMIHPTKPRTLYLSRARSGAPPELLVSRDGGDTWSVLGPLPFYLERLAVDPGTGTVYGLGSGGGTSYGSLHSILARSADGKAWETVFAAPTSEGEIARLSFRPGHPKQRTLTIGWGLYRSFDGGASWSWRAAPLQLGDVALDGDDPNRLIAVSTYSAHLSQDGGQTWHTTASYLTYGEGLIRGDRDTLFAIGCGVTRSTDNGTSWREVLPCYPPDADAGRWTAKLDLDPVRPDRVYTLSFEARIDGLPHGPLQADDWPSILWRSEDGGTTWRKAAANLRAFALERGTGRLYGVRGTTLLASGDAGRTWRAVGTVAAGLLDLIADPAFPGALYANGSSGLQWSADRGAAWTTLGPTGGWALQFDPANPKVIFSGIEDGVYRLTVP